MSASTTHLTTYIRQSSAFLRRPQKFEKISHLFWCYWVKTAVLSKQVEIFSNFVAFSQCLNFTQLLPIVPNNNQKKKIALHFYCFWTVLVGRGGIRGQDKAAEDSFTACKQRNQAEKFCSSASPYCLYCFRSRKLKVRKWTKSFSFSCWQHKNTQRKITHGEMPHTHIRRAGRIGTPWPHFYTQLLYMPHLRTWILQFGPLGSKGKFLKWRKFC